MKKISIIGGGNLGSAIADGLLVSGFAKANDIIVTKRNLGSLSRFAEAGVAVSDNNKMAIENGEVVILALKPYQVKEFLSAYACYFKEEQIVISTVTGVWMRELRDLLGIKGILYRAMPNTAIAIRESMTCLACESTDHVTMTYVQALFGKLGRVVIIEEKLMDAATVLGACGTAFAMRYTRANIQGGIEIGFDAATATEIAAQTIKGAAQMLLEHKTHPEQEIDKVTTPKGCTIAGLNEMEHQGFSSSLIKGILASYERIG